MNNNYTEKPVTERLSQTTYDLPNIDCKFNRWLSQRAFLFI